MMLPVRLITHIVPISVEDYPALGEFRALKYYTRDLERKDIYFIGSTEHHFPRTQICGLAVEKSILELEQEILVDHEKTILCTSRGEIIYANKKDPKKDGDWRFVTKLAEHI